MSNQTLAKFQAVFSMEVVRFDFDDFPKDGAFSDQAVRDGLIEEGIDAIYLKPLSSAAQADLEASMANVGSKKGRDLHNFYARFVAPAWYDAEGNQIGNAQEIGQLRADIVSTLFTKVNEMNGKKSDAIEEAGKD